MECLQLRSQPEPFHYLISEQAKSLVALQELQNEVGALLEFRDLVIETFPNLRSKMAPSTPASGTRRDWEPGVRVRRKLAGSAGDSARAKPQPSVQDSGFSTETSCGKDAHSSASASASASRSRPLEDELWALLDVIQRKGGRLRDDAEMLRGELDQRNDTAEESFTRVLSESACGDCVHVQRLRRERDALLARTAQLEAQAASAPTHSAPAITPDTPLGRLDSILDTPLRPPRIHTPDSRKFAAILLESNPVELQRQLLTSTVQNQVLRERVRRVLAQRTLLLEKLERARDVNEDLKFRLEEKSIEAEGARARVRQLEGCGERDRERGRDAYTSMRDMEPLPMPAEGTDEEARHSETPRRGRPSRIPLHTAHKGAAPRPPPPPRPPSAHSAHSVRSARSTASARSRADRRETKSAVPVRRSPTAPAPPSDAKRTGQTPEGRCESSDWDGYDSLEAVQSRDLAEEYVSRLASVQRRYSALPTHSLAAELARSLLHSALHSAPATVASAAAAPASDSLWSGKPQHYYDQLTRSDPDDYDADSLVP